MNLREYRHELVVVDCTNDGGNAVNEVLYFVMDCFNQHLGINNIDAIFLIDFEYSSKLFNAQVTCGE